MTTSTSTRVLREPFLQFVVLGALIFAGHAALGGGRDGARIDVTAADLARLRAVALKQTGREPDAARLQALAEDWVRQEVLYREALAQGLDRDDEIIRRRLVQKMEFLAGQDVAEPAEGALRVWLSEHAADYAEPERTGFTQLYFGARRDEALRARRQLAAGATAEAIGGEAFLLPRDLPPAPAALIARDFGAAFATALAQQPQGQWAGPIESAHGFHLVRVNRRDAPALPDLETARERVRADLISRRTAEARDRAYAALRTRYTVTVAPAPSPSLALAR